MVKPFLTNNPTAAQRAQAFAANAVNTVKGEAQAPAAGRPPAPAVVRRPAPAPGATPPPAAGGGEPPYRDHRLQGWVDSSWPEDFTASRAGVANWSNHTGRPVVEVVNDAGQSYVLYNVPEGPGTAFERAGGFVAGERRNLTPEAATQQLVAFAEKSGLTEEQFVDLVNNQQLVQQIIHNGQKDALKKFGDELQSSTPAQRARTLALLAGEELPPAPPPVRPDGTPVTPAAGGDDWWNVPVNAFAKTPLKEVTPNHLAWTAAGAGGVASAIILANTLMQQGRQQQSGDAYQMLQQAANAY